MREPPKGFRRLTGQPANRGPASSRGREVKRRSAQSGKPSPVWSALLGLGIMLVLSPLALAACSSDVGEQTATLDTIVTTATMTSDVSATATVMDTGETTASTTPASVPALESGITPEQVLELVESKSSLPAEDWELRDCENLGDWAVANLYASVFSEQMDERGVTAVFEKRGGSWFQAGWVSVSDPPYQQEIELANMGAPEEVWRYFGLVPKETAQLYPPEEMPADFGFVASYGVMGRNVIDTLEGTFIKDLGLAEEQATTRLSLPRQALETLYRDLVLMQNQWQVFTEAFSPDPDPANTGTTTYTYTYYTYRLEWRAAGFRPLPIVWEDSALSTDFKAVALRDWFEKLRQMIEATPEWKALPAMMGGYE